MANGTPALAAEPVGDGGHRGRTGRVGLVGTNHSRGGGGLMTSTEDDEMMSRFVHDYLDLLDERVLAIDTNLTNGDLMAAEVAMLSLESSSTMVGATELAKIVRQLRVTLGRGDRSQFPHLVHALRAEASAVPGQLLGVYRH